MLNVAINNFRGFKNSILDISKINILIGENSGGKSSFIKLLLLLKQSMETPNKEKKIIVDGHILDLGTFDKFISHDSVEKSFQITMTTDEYYYEYYYEYIFRDKEDADSVLKKCDYIFQAPTSLSFLFNKIENEIFTNYISIYHQSIGTLKIILSEDMHNKRFSDIEILEGTLILEHVNKGLIEISNVTFNVFGFMLFATPSSIRAYEKEHELDNLFNEIAFMLLSQNYFSSLLRNIKYINPIKFEPARILLKRDTTSNKSITDYETLINVLSSLKESNDPESKEILEIFNSAIREIGIADEVQLETNESMPVSELKVKTGGVWNSIVDVGYGVGLQIPIILQTIICFVQKTNNLLIIEQPEIHLHPALHARFVEVLVKYAGNTKFIIETHSEHIIRKLQVLAKGQNINFQLVNINYFKNNNGVFEISRHEINEDGHLKPVFPKGFYDNSYTLSKALYE